MTNAEVPFDSNGISIRPIACRRCGTPLALVAESDEWSVEQRSDILSMAARTLSARLQLYRSGETVPAYLVVHDAPADGRVLLVWPPEHRSILNGEEFRNVRSLLQRLHRCLTLPRLF